nr:unnamed protein product [Digitaria exilis]
MLSAPAVFCPVAGDAIRCGKACVPASRPQIWRRRGEALYGTRGLGPCVAPSQPTAVAPEREEEVGWRSTRRRGRPEDLPPQHQPWQSHPEKTGRAAVERQQGQGPSPTEARRTVERPRRPPRSPRRAWPWRGTCGARFRAAIGRSRGAAGPAVPLRPCTLAAAPIFGGPAPGMGRFRARGWEQLAGVGASAPLLHVPLHAAGQSSYRAGQAEQRSATGQSS